MSEPKPLVILMVDDEEPIRRVLKRTLERGGFHVLEASNGQEALDLADAYDGKIDLLLTDMVMPGMPGRDVHVALQARRPGLPAVFMSGTSPLGLSPGSVFIAKPFSPTQLVAIIRALLNVP